MRRWCEILLSPIRHHGQPVIVVQGLGASGAGIAAPVAASGVAASAGTKLGLGQQVH